MRNPFFLLTVFALSALAAGWLYPGNRTPDVASTAATGGGVGVSEETFKTGTATVARVDPAADMAASKGPDAGSTASGMGEGVKDLPEVKAGDRILEPGSDSVAVVQEAVIRSEANQRSADGLVQLVETTRAAERLGERLKLGPPKGSLAESATPKVPDSNEL
ncbi:MAG: hypothetical protein LJE63_15620 [Desulfobacteraceae bacterium]|nr:hypothetical protein [Desulfobacteraceae bacterium]